MQDDKMIGIIQELVKSLFDYRDGDLYWRVRPSNRVKIGSKAGALGGRGYYSIGINGKRYYTHRLIFLYNHGHLPQYLDHIDNDPLNNQIENLRSATKSQNSMNRESRKNSSSIYKGVSWDKDRNEWVSFIKIDNKSKYLGCFESEKAAAFIYNVYARAAFGEYANLNDI